MPPTSPKPRSFAAAQSRARARRVSGPATGASRQAGGRAKAAAKGAGRAKAAAKGGARAKAAKKGGARAKGQDGGIVGQVLSTVTDSGADAAKGGLVGKVATTAAKGGAKAATGGAKALVKEATPGGSSLTTKLAAAAARRALKLVLRKALRTSARAIRAATEQGTALGKSALENGRNNRLPIQVSVDVAVPIEVAWDEFLNWGSLPEGVHRVQDVERDGAQLSGSIGPRGAEWEADIVDEREQESFAWRSTEGSDCAGLATFHRLSARLTRIELDLDVVPTNPLEAVTLTTHLAHHRAESDLRRFKAHVEFINPDVYEDILSRNGNAPEEAADSDE